MFLALLFATSFVELPPASSLTSSAASSYELSMTLRRTCTLVPVARRCAMTFGARNFSFSMSLVRSSSSAIAPPSGVEALSRLSSSMMALTMRPACTHASPTSSAVAARRDLQQSVAACSDLRLLAEAPPRASAAHAPRRSPRLESLRSAFRGGAGPSCARRRGWRADGSRPHTGHTSSSLGKKHVGHTPPAVPGGNESTRGWPKSCHCSAAGRSDDGNGASSATRRCGRRSVRVRRVGWSSKVTSYEYGSGFSDRP